MTLHPWRDKAIAKNVLLAPCCEHRVDEHQGDMRRGSCGGAEGKCSCAIGRTAGAQRARHRRDRRLKRATLLKLRSCPVCGCTEDEACAGGCAWVADSKICSTCASALEVA